MTIGDIAKAVDSEANQKVIGIRPGEKIHEQMIGLEDAPHEYEYCKILPAIHGWSSDPLRIKDGKPVVADFTYSSDNNSEWMTVDELKTWIEKNKHKIGPNIMHQKPSFFF